MAAFFINGIFNRQHYRFWSLENPYWIVEAYTQYLQKVNVWIGIINDQILGLYFFFYENLNALRYPCEKTI